MIGFNPEREDRLIEQKIEKIKQSYDLEANKQK